MRYEQQDRSDLEHRKNSTLMQYRENEAYEQ